MRCRLVDLLFLVKRVGEESWGRSGEGKLYDQKRDFFGQKRIKNMFGATKRCLLYIFICAFSGLSILLFYCYLFVLFANFSKQIKYTNKPACVGGESKQHIQAFIYSLFSFNN